jgi:hypothetical protein
VAIHRLDGVGVRKFIDEQSLKLMVKGDPHPALL